MVILIKSTIIFDRLIRPLPFGVANCFELLGLDLFNKSYDLSFIAHEAAVQFALYNIRDKANIGNLSCFLVPDLDRLAAQNEDFMA